MYLRTTKRTNKDGSVVTYYQLAHNERDPVTKKPVAKIIHSFGRADELERDQLVRLCRSIARVCNLEVIDPFDNDAQLPLTSTVGLPLDLKLHRTYPYGVPLLAETLWERLGIGNLLRSICKKNALRTPYDLALLAMVTNRLCKPESKLGVWDRWLPTVYMPSCQDLKLKQMYEAMDLLYDHAEEVEKHVFFHTANLFNLKVDLIFYDTTTASFSIDQEDDLRRFGHSKEGTWTPQVVVALAVTPEGLPVKSWVFPGNTADVSTVERVRSDLRGWNLNRAIFVADSAINSKNSREELARACGRYHVIRDNLHAKEVIIGDGERRRRYILCYNPKEAERQKRRRAEIVRFLEEELARHPKPKATARWAIDLLASLRFKRYLKVTKGGLIRINRGAIQEASKYDGRWLIETNDDTISLEDAACGYKGLMVIERCFRSLKRTRIKMSPVHHWVPRRIEAHVKICVLALLMERLAELRCEKPWSRIKLDLEELQISYFSTSEHTFYRTNEISSNVRRMLKSLKISPPKLIRGIEKHTQKL
ncbi:MAG: IS1634 family transposase [Nitrospirota bacterium]|nr:MAG: IS1634 family transposase [Nitrospirota bacterium]